MLSDFSSHLQSYSFVWSLGFFFKSYFSQSYSPQILAIKELYFVVSIQPYCLLLITSQ